MSAITDLYDKARRGLAQGDAGYWQAAEAMAELADRGQSHRAIADELGVGKTTVANYLAVYSAHRGGQNKRPSFAQAMAEYRGPREQPHIPKTPERRAELAADLLKDKAVADAPVVRKAVDRHVQRRLKQSMQDFNREHNIPTRTEQTQQSRRTSVVINRIFWSDLLLALNQVHRLLNDAAGELERTGLPNDRAGDIIKAARVVGQAAERFGKSATARAVGSPMEPDRDDPRVKSS